MISNDAILQYLSYLQTKLSSEPKATHSYEKQISSFSLIKYRVSLIFEAKEMASSNLSFSLEADFESYSNEKGNIVAI